MTYFVSRLALSDEHLQAIGLIAAEWSILEITTEQMIMHFIAENWEKGRAITVEMGAVSRINAILALSKIEALQGKISPDHLKKLESLCNRLDSLRAERNKIVHGYWISPTEIVKVTAKRELSVSHKSATIQEMNQIATDIAKLREEIWAFMLDELESGYFV